MNPKPMSNVHQMSLPWAWQLEHREAVTLKAARTPRWLRVDEGCVWITARRAGPEAEDIWLCAGQNLALPAGSEWVLQAWPQARLSLLLAAPASLRPAARAWPSWAAWQWPSWLRARVA